jgi:hypothetical protein
MKRTALQLSFAAAAMLAAAATGSAQTMRAEVPFPFTAAGARMQPGDYAVAVRPVGAARPIVQITNQDTRRAVLVLPASTDLPRDTGSHQYVMTFACREGDCALISLREGSEITLNFTRPKLGEGVHIATVVLHSGKS